MRFLTIVLFALATTAFGGSVTTTTPVFDFSGGSTSCSPISGLTMCSWSSWWNNANQVVTKWAESGSYDSTIYVESGKDITNNYNWGNSNGSSVSGANSGSGWSMSDYYNLALDTWNGLYAASDGWANQWSGNSTQQNHTLGNNIYSWLCVGGKCKEDFWFWNTNQYDYSSNYWNLSTTFGDYYDSNSGSYNFSSLTGNMDHQIFEWDQYGTIVPTENSALTATPEPGSMAMIGAGLAALGFFRRKR